MNPIQEKIDILISAAYGFLDTVGDEIFFQQTDLEEFVCTIENLPQDGGIRMGVKFEVVETPTTLLEKLGFVWNSPSESWVLWIKKDPRNV